MKTVLCENRDRLLSEEAFSIYASCMYHPTYEEYKAQTDDDSIGFYRKCGFTEEKLVKEYSDGEVVRYNCVLCK